MISYANYLTRINKYAKIDYVSYTKYYSNISKSYNIHFDIYYNSENTANKNNIGATNNVPNNNVKGNAPFPYSFLIAVCLSASFVIPSGVASSGG